VLAPPRVELPLDRPQLHGRLLAEQRPRRRRASPAPGPCRPAAAHPALPEPLLAAGRAQPLQRRARYRSVQRGGRPRPCRAAPRQSSPCALQWQQRQQQRRALLNHPRAAPGRQPVRRRAGGSGCLDSRRHARRWHCVRGRAASGGAPVRCLAASGGVRVVAGRLRHLTAGTGGRRPSQAVGEFAIGNWRLCGAEVVSAGPASLAWTGGR
jgi:hypothetical protein